MKEIIFCMMLLLMVGCSSVVKDMLKEGEPIAERGVPQQTINFSDIPQDLIKSIQFMGVDTSKYLNAQEGQYFNLIFGIDTSVFSLVGKKVGFVGGKQQYFMELNERYRSGSESMVYSRLYLFDSTLKEQLYGYDAAITAWKSIPSPTDVVIKQTMNRVYY